MAGEDYSVKTKVTADVSNFEKGMNKAEKSLKGFSDKLANSIDRLGKKGLIGSIANVTIAMKGLTGSLSTVIKFAQEMGKAINECTEAYKGQVIAERALDTAIANNPFITGSSSKALKEFASEMQKVSNYGDEQLIPMMTNLVSLGRTESETMQIMSVAMDMSAGMGISLDSAITQLNATLNGSIGRLGQQNAELKGLTEEELRQGKAIEILGEKFKGLSSATADTSKQLQNIKGDFKETLGQFTLPSSDMWNKFWTGFYEKGIAVIQKFNDYLDVKIIGKQLVENLYSNARTVAKANKLKVDDVFMDFRYVREELSYLNDSELATLQKTLERQKERTQGEERILATVKQMLRNKELEADQERANAEAEAKRAKAEAERLAKEKALAEQRKKDAEELAKAKEKALQNEKQWQDKILSQQISILENEKESAVAGAEERGEATYEVERYYNEKILALKLQQIENEREEALKGENVTADAKIAINQYYDNEVKKIYDDLGKYKAKKNKEEVKETKTALQETLKNVANIMQEVSKKMTDTFSKVVSKIKSIFSGVGGFLSKLFEFKPDEVLDNILKFEDSVLTFFVETLPKTPNFFESVFQSISVLLKSIRKYISADDIRQIVRGILKLFTDNLPQMIDDLVIIVEELVDGVIDGLIEWLDSDEGLEKLLELILKIQKAVEKLVTKNLDKLVDMLAKHIDDFSNFLAESMTSANNTLPKLTDAVLKLIGVIIKAVAGAFKNQEFIDSIVNAIVEMTNSIMDNLPEIIGAIVDLIFAIINALAPRLPEIVIAFVNKLAETIPKIHNQLISSLASGIGELFSGLFRRIFTWDFWKDALKTLGEVLLQIVAATFTLGLSSLTGKKPHSTTGSTAGDLALDFLVPFGFLGHFLAKGTNNAPAGLSIVGEAGPELVRFRGGEQVINNRNTQKLLSDAGGKTINQSITFNNVKDTSAYAMMNQLKQYNRQMAINGII